MKGPVYKLPLGLQFPIAIAAIVLVSVLCFFSTAVIGYKGVALLLLMAVSLLALLFDIVPVLISAVLSAFIWNIFFIPPLFTFHISETEDMLMFLLYFIIALVHSVLIFKVKQAERKASMKKEKENAIKLYNTVFNSLSHELRTPIATIIGAVDMLKQQKIQLSKEQTDALLKEMETAGIRLNREVENLLNISRMETGMLQPQTTWCDIQELVHSVLQKFTATQTQNIHLITEEELPLFKLDIGIVEQIIYNLIHNAIRYTEAGTRIEIEIKSKEDFIEMVVRDFGQGLTEQERKKIFQKFYRIPVSGTEGIGLGLSIVKGFTESLGGTIEVSAAKPTGLSFTVSIPCAITYINQLKNE